MITNKKICTYIKLLLIIGFISLDILIISLYSNPASGYEYSIYAYLNKVDYITIAIIIGVLLISIYISNKISTPKYIHIQFMTLVTLTGIVIYSIHILRGYYIWNGFGDPASHLAYAKFIEEYGKLWTAISGYMYYTADYYPMLHLLHAVLSMIPGISLIRLHNWLPTYFWIFYFVFLYLLVTTLLDTSRKKNCLENSNGRLMFVAFLLLIPLHEWYLNLTPNHSYNLAWFPIILYSILKSEKNRKYLALLVVVLTMTQFWHPLAFIAGIIVLAAFYIPSNRKMFTYSVTIMTIIFTIWMSQLWPGVLFVKSMYHLLSSNGEVSIPIGSLARNVNLAQNYGYNPWILLMKLWGLRLSILALTGITLLNDLKDRRLRWDTPVESNLGLAILVTGGIMTGLFILPIGFAPLRLFYYLLIFGLLYTLTRNKNALPVHLSKRKTGVILVLILLSAFSLGFATLYPSPFTLTPNLQTTKNELVGVNWFVDKYNKEYKIVGTYNLPLGRYVQILLDPYQISSLGTPFTKWYLPASNTLPPHFGYINYTTICWKYQENSTYLIITSFDMLKYEKVLPKLQKTWYYPQDFKRLYIDQGTNRIYLSKDIQIFTISCGGNNK